MKNTGVLIFICLFLSWGNMASSQEVVNGSFELVGPNKMPRNWIKDDAKGKFDISVVNDKVLKGSCSLKIAANSATAAVKDVALAANQFGAISLTRINTIEITVWLNADKVADSTVSVFIQDLRGERIIRSFLKANTGKGWQQQTLTFTPQPDRPWYGFYYGVEVKGNRTVWCDNLSIKVNGIEIKDAISLYTEPDKAVVSWLEKHIAPLSSPVTDTMPVAIGQLTANVKIVALGEATHGTSEAGQFKLSMLKYLVEEKGFTTIALEEVIPTCDIMNGLLTKNNPALRDSLLSLPFYKVWKTKEMLALLTWINQYNTTHDKKIKLIGIDMEDLKAKTSRNRLRAYGLLQDGALLKQVKAIDTEVDSLLKLSKLSMENEATTKAAAVLKNQLQLLKTYIGNKGGDEEMVFTLLSYVRVCEQWLASRFFGGSRDAYMAENMAFYLDKHPNEKIMLWAHNFHIGNTTIGGAKVMGALLKEKFAASYCPISITTASGSYMATPDFTQQKWNTYTLQAAYRGTYEYVLGKAKPSSYFLGLSNLKKSDKQAGWLSETMKQLDLGYVYSDEEDAYKYQGNLATSFDGVVFFKETHATTSLL